MFLVWCGDGYDLCAGWCGLFLKMCYFRPNWALLHGSLPAILPCQLCKYLIMDVNWIKFKLNNSIVCLSEVDILYYFSRTLILCRRDVNIKDLFLCFKIKVITMFVFCVIWCLVWLSFSAVVTKSWLFIIFIFPTMSWEREITQELLNYPALVQCCLSGTSTTFTTFSTSTTSTTDINQLEFPHYVCWMVKIQTNSSSSSHYLLVLAISIII